MIYKKKEETSEKVRRAVKKAIEKIREKEAIEDSGTRIVRRRKEGLEQN